jgi:acetyltransferase-like isoleucine patch superfamily enzyme
MQGCYIQAVNKIIIGTKTRTGPGVKIISANHDIISIDTLLPSSPIIIGDGCWLGANAVILPGVILGDHTIVGAGAVVTKPFEDGYCVVGGVPAKVIKNLDKNQFIHETM